MENHGTDVFNCIYFLSDTKPVESGERILRETGCRFTLEQMRDMFFSMIDVRASETNYRNSPYYKNRDLMGWIADPTEDHGMYDGEPIYVKNIWKKIYQKCCTEL